MISSVAFAEANRDERTDKQKDMIQTDNPAKAFGEQKDDIRRGMTKKELLEIFPRKTQLGYRKGVKKEWFTFSDPEDKDGKGKITFYLKNSRVVGWKKHNGELKEMQDELDKLNNQTWDDTLDLH